MHYRNKWWRDGTRAHKYITFHDPFFWVWQFSMYFIAIIHCRVVWFYLCCRVYPLLSLYPFLAVTTCPAAIFIYITPSPTRLTSCSVTWGVRALDSGKFFTRPFSMTTELRAMRVRKEERHKWWYDAVPCIWNLNAGMQVINHCDFIATSEEISIARSTPFLGTSRNRKWGTTSAHGTRYVTSHYAECT